jgi:nucleotide-binding universal stress UspA family protein
MTLAVAHQVSETGRVALRHALREARRRDTDLAVVHVVASALDADKREAYRLGVADEIERVVGSADGPSWTLHLATEEGDLGERIIQLVDEVGAELLVIGARRRSPLGKALLGSAAQTIILGANVPVLVVKSDRVSPRARPSRSSAS